jgi:hypothetical protein
MPYAPVGSNRNRSRSSRRSVETGSDSRSLDIDSVKEYKGGVNFHTY